MHSGRPGSVYEVYQDAVEKDQKFPQERTEICCFQAKGLQKKMGNSRSYSLQEYTE